MFGISVPTTGASVPTTAPPRPAGWPRPYPPLTHLHHPTCPNWPHAPRCAGVFGPVLRAA